MRRIGRAVTSISVLLWASSGAAQTPDDLPKLIEPLVRHQLETRDIAGAVVAVVRAGAAPYVQAFGTADVASARPMTSDTRLRLASMSKVFTTVAVMQLVDHGRLDLDRDVNAYLNFSIPAGSDGRPVTLRRILTHQEGFEDTIIGIATAAGPRQALAAYLPRRLPGRLRHADGIAYSNYAFAVAAAVVERVSGRAFEEYLEQFVFEPLQMTATTARQPVPAAWQALTSAGYDRGSQQPTTRSMAALTIHEAGSTGVVSTAHDMARFIGALLDPPAGFLSASAISAMTQPQVKSPNGFVALALYSPLAAGGNALIGHDGGSGGFHGSVGLAPDQRFGVFVLYNSSGVPGMDAPEGELLRVLSDRYAGAPVRTSTATTETVSGVYEPVRRVRSNLFALDALIGQLRIRQDDGAILVNLGFMPFGGRLLRQVGPGVFSGPGIEISFAALSTGMHAQIGAPVLTYRRVPWWYSARTLVPLIAGSLVLALVVTVRWAWRILRGRPSGAVAGRLSLILNATAILAALWLTMGGRVLAATAPPELTIVLLGIYAAAWSGGCLALLAISQVLGGRTNRRWRDATIAVVAVFMSGFSIAWHIAGTSLP
jgi:CubicO group peptidase (beta-lactamase class C family)